MLSNIIQSLILIFLIEGSSSQCSEEFDTCVMNRDCCEGLKCVTGDWAVTSDSTCLSERSETLNALSSEEKIQLVQQFYQKEIHESPKTQEEAEALARKYSRNFANLVARLERKYDVTLTEKGNDEL